MKSVKIDIPIWDGGLMLAKEVNGKPKTLDHGVSFVLLKKHALILAEALAKAAETGCRVHVEPDSIEIVWG